MSEVKSILRRVNIIRGQLEGVGKMIEEGRTCKDVLCQIKAIKVSFNKVAEEYLKKHVKECLADHTKSPKLSEKKFNEILSIFSKL